MAAASIAADLWARHKSGKGQKYQNRNVLRADVKIVASAKAAGATDFYSHDKKCRALAGLAMTAKELPKRDPTDMFAVKDIERGEL